MESTADKGKVRARLDSIRDDIEKAESDIREIAKQYDNAVRTLRTKIARLQQEEAQYKELLGRDG